MRSYCKKTCNYGIFHYYFNFFKIHTDDSDINYGDTELQN